jgi:hypothetical protein
MASLLTPPPLRQTVVTGEPHIGAAPVPAVEGGDEGKCIAVLAARTAIPSALSRPADQAGPRRRAVNRLVPTDESAVSAFDHVIAGHGEYGL